jgi:hypothetical protein
MRTAKLVVASALVAASLPAVADPVITNGVASRSSIDWIELSHDASATFPVLGSPTSLLQHQPLATVGAELSVRVDFDAGYWARASLSGSPLGVGLFRDADYATGNVLTSETFSLALSNDAAVDVSFGVSSISWGSVSVAPFVRLGAARRMVENRGLKCGAACAVPPRAPDTVVIGQLFTRLDASVGAEFTMPLSMQDMLSASLRGGAGALNVDDSHFLRKDLGPTPNVLYGFWTATAEASVGYARDLNPSTSIHVDLIGRATWGTGNILFDPSSPSGPYPASVTSYAGGIELGLRHRL